MQTIVVSRSVEIDAGKGEVMAVIGDARQLPAWAPGFAREVRRAGDGWVSTHPSGFDLPFELKVDAESGTADVVVTSSPPRGAYLRALETGTGCHLTLTIIVPAADGAGEAGQQEVAEAELRAIGQLVGVRP